MGGQLIARNPVFAAGGGGASNSFAFGANLPRPEYWNPVYPFLDIALCSGDNWRKGGATGVTEYYPRENPILTNDYGWPTNVPNGASVNRIVKWNGLQTPGKPGRNYIKAGNYTLIGPANWYMELVNQIGITAHTPGMGSCTFTIANSELDFRIWVQATNNTGGTASLPPRSVKCYLTSNAAAVSANEDAFDPDFLANLSGYPQVRFTDVMTVNGTYEWRDINDVPPLNKFLGGVWPSEMVGKLTATLNKEMWVNMPTFFTRANCIATGAPLHRIIQIPWGNIPNGDRSFVGTPTAVTATTVTLPVGASTTNDWYVDTKLYVFEATLGSGQAVTITAYNGSTRVATFASWPSATPVGIGRVVINPSRPYAENTKVMLMGIRNYDATPMYTKLGLPDCGAWHIVNNDGYSFQLAHPSAPFTPITLSAPSGTTDLGFSLVDDYATQWQTIISRIQTAHPGLTKGQIAVWLEFWSGSYLGLSLNQTVGRYLYDGHRPVDPDNTPWEGQAHMTWLAWRAFENIYGTTAHHRVFETGLPQLNNPALDIIDTNGIISVGAKMGDLLRSIAVATYYALFTQSVPPWGGIDWYSPAWTSTALFTALGNGTINENEWISSGTDMQAILDANGGTIPNAVFLNYLRNSLHFINLHLRFWRNHMLDRFNRVHGVDYTFRAYETGNHVRVSGVYTGQVSFQDQFIAFNYGNSPEIQQFRLDWKKTHTDSGFDRAMQFISAGEWNGREGLSGDTMQWGAVPWAGAEVTYPSIGYYLAFLKANV